MYPQVAWKAYDWLRNEREHRERERADNQIIALQNTKYKCWKCESDQIQTAMLYLSKLWMIATRIMHCQ